MSLIPGEGREIVPNESDAAIRVGVSAREQLETRWGLILVVFMRLLAALWILQGLAQWAQFMLPSDEIFDHLSTGQTGAIIFFSVIDLLAAVGLWLATPWGGVLWLFAAISQIFVAFSVAQVFGGQVSGGQVVGGLIFGGRIFGGLRSGADVLLIVLYFALTWQAGTVSRAT